MNIKRTLSVSLTLSAAAVLAACSSQPAQQPVTVDVSSSGIPSRKADSQSKILSDYSQYEGALEAAKRGDDVWPQQFLAQASDSAMAENVRNEWLKNLGYRGQWALFQQEYAKLDKDGRAQEVQCYADLNGGNYAKAADLVRETKKLPQGCTRFIESAAASGRLNGDDAWRRVRGLLGNSQTTDARNLAAALGSPFDGGGQGAAAGGGVAVGGHPFGVQPTKGPVPAQGVGGGARGLAQRLQLVLDAGTERQRDQVHSDEHEGSADDQCQAQPGMEGPQEGGGDQQLKQFAGRIHQGLEHLATAPHVGGQSRDPLPGHVIPAGAAQGQFQELLAQFVFRALDSVPAEPVSEALGGDDHQVHATQTGQGDDEFPPHPGGLGPRDGGRDHRVHGAPEPRRDQGGGQPAQGHQDGTRQRPAPGGTDDLPRQLRRRGDVVEVDPEPFRGCLEQSVAMLLP